MAVLLRKGFTTQLRLQPTPEIVDAALPCATAKHRPEVGRSTPLGFGGESIKGSGEIPLQLSRQCFWSLATSRVVVEQNGFTEANENLRKTLFPKHELR